MKFKLFNLALISSVLLLTASCSPLSPVSAPPQNTYLLNPKIFILKTGNNKTTKNKTLLISTPEVPAWLNTSRMLYKTADSQINYFVENRWVAGPPEMLKAIIAKNLSETGLYHAVVQTPFGGNVDQRLDVQIINMEQNFSQNPSVYKFEVQAELVSMLTGNIIRTRHFSYVIPATTNNPQGGVEAANKAIEEWIPQLIDFCRKSPANT